MKGVRRVCPSCWHHNKAISFGVRGGRNCPFCGNQVRPAPLVLGDTWRAILKEATA